MSRCLTSSGDVQVDDTDPGIVYNGAWSTVFGPMDPSHYTLASYNNSIHSSAHSGDTATFTFVGTHVEVWGTIGDIAANGQPNSTYTIDGANPPDLYQAWLGAHNLYYIPLVEFFVTQSVLSQQQHTLVITHEDIHDNSKYFLDFIVFTPSEDASHFPPCAAPTLVSTGSDSASHALTTVFVHSVPTGAIVGAAMGSLSVMALMIALGVLFLVKRQRRNRIVEAVDGNKPDVTPRSPEHSRMQIFSAHPPAATTSASPDDDPLTLHSSVPSWAQTSPFPLSPSHPPTYPVDSKVRKLLGRRSAPSSDTPPAYGAQL